MTDWRATRSCPGDLRISSWKLLPIDSQIDRICLTLLPQNETVSPKNGNDSGRTSSKVFGLKQEQRHSSSQSEQPFERCSCDHVKYSVEIRLPSDKVIQFYATLSTCQASIQLLVWGSRLTRRVHCLTLFESQRIRILCAALGKCGGQSNHAHFAYCVWRQRRRVTRRSVHSVCPKICGNPTYGDFGGIYLGLIVRECPK